ncbi:TIGR04282 family arsenosugar biosynthesis glycosyltransferase [Methylorubrum thiocyanatum]|uniref:TIGR04282 family arsenosugar biosynthesis glycosyltransferase n=1 Tax=Methylorubrum thiocyanatum TaxID=47958 RepID=UPI00398C5228
MSDTVALGIMCKAPRPGVTKTRLARVVGAERAAALSGCFLRDVAAGIASLPADLGARGYGVYAPAGTEEELRALLPEGFRLLLQEGEDLGAALAGAVRALIGPLGHAGAVLINADSPSLPPALLVQAVEALRAPGDRVVLAPASDGGYVLIGLKAEHPELFADIPWSTPAVYAATCARAAAAGLPVAALPMWYDIDDGETFAILEAELAGKPLPFATALRGGPALSTRALLGLPA